MSAVVAFYGHDTTSHVACHWCGWTGLSRDLRVSVPSEDIDIVAFECPACFENVLITAPTTPDEMRAAAARGNTRAIADLASS